MKRLVWTGLLATCLACSPEYAFRSLGDVDPSLVTDCDFQPVVGAPGVRAYTCNPVFVEDAVALSGVDFGDVDVAGHAFYQLWFADRDGVWTAASANGTSWEGLEPTDWPRDAWDDGQVQNVRVAFDADQQQYHMVYHAYSSDSEPFFGIGQAVSEDGVHWEKNPMNPVLSASYPTGGRYLSWPVDYAIDGGVHRAVFAATLPGETALQLVELEAEHGDWGAATSRVVQRPGTSGMFDDEGFLDADFVELDGRLYLFYVGIAEWEDNGSFVTARGTRFGAKVSDDDGQTWRDLFDGPLPIGQRRTGAVGIAARVVGPRIHIWATDDYDLGEEEDEVAMSGVGYFLYDPGTELDEETR